MSNENGKNPEFSLAERLKKRGRNYFAFMRCPIDGTPLQVDNNRVTCSEGHHHYSRDGIIFLLSDEQKAVYDKQSTTLETQQLANGWAIPAEDTFKSLPQTALEGWPLGFWDNRAFTTAELWRFLEDVRHEADLLPIGDLGSVADLTGDMGWLGYGMDVAGYTVLVVGEDAGKFGINAYPYARYPRIQASIANPPLGENQFDFVLYSFSLPQLENPKIALANGAKLLKKGGYLIVLLDEDQAEGRNWVTRAEEGIAEAGLTVQRQKVGGMGGRLKKLSINLRGGPGVPPLVIGKK